MLTLTLCMYLKKHRRDQFMDKWTDTMLNQHSKFYTTCSKNTLETYLDYS